MTSAQGDPALASMMALVLMNLGELPQAIFFAQKAATLLPQDFRTRMNLAGLFATERRFAEAMREIDVASALEPANPEPHQLATLCLLEQGLHAAARQRCARGLALAPNDHDLQITRANTLLDCGDAPGALAALDDLATAYPDDAFVHSTRALVMNYVDGLEPARVRAAHQSYGALVTRLAPDLTPATPRRPGPLRVGFVTPDLRGHSVAMFMRPLLRYLDRREFHTFVYFTNRFEDDTSRACRELVHTWRDCGNISDAALAALVARDDLDVCLELSGHTKGHSLAAIASHPARVVATYLGYPNTTGVPRVDVRIVDSHTDPPGQSDAHATERLVRLDPCFVCFEPPVDAPDVLPREAASPPTFVSFNAAPKLSPRVRAMWAGVMKRVPSARLVLKASHFSEAALRDEVRAGLEALGVEPGRVEILPPTPGRAAHLAAYHAGDVALDTFPYHGTTTTLEALWMGLPVVSLAGSVHASRVGVSLLHAAGLGELVATSEDEFIDTAAELVMNAPRLAALRAGLRERVRQSALCDGPGFAGRFGTLLRQMSHRDGQPERSARA